MPERSNNESPDSGPHSFITPNKGNQMSLKTPRNGLKAVAKAKWEAEQAALRAETAAKSAAFARALDTERDELDAL